MSAGTHDAEIIHELFVRDAYRPPEKVQQALSSLGRPLYVADLGANIGAFSVFIQAALQVDRLLSVEPDSENFSLLKACAAKNASDIDWQLIQAAAATTPGSVPFLSGRYASSRVACGSESRYSTQVPSIDVFPHICEADLVKIDIEGSEWRLLTDPRFSALQAAAVVLEYHKAFCPYPAPREAARTLLRNAGFVVGQPFNVYALREMVWGYRVGL